MSQSVMVCKKQSAVSLAGGFPRRLRANAKLPLSLALGASLALRANQALDRTDAPPGAGSAASSILDSNCAPLIFVLILVRGSGQLRIR
ncbi:MAG: hypothetical protein M9935_00780 [Kiritimatiellae bacterium]|nr:hypothetical protein [Kiritimatiellia bacterium]